ncbi:phospholipase B1, membrane-associated-like [Condylostylus longicornis]|uniref:phospholipase B1, membrane-associated-like n=1 Tax=Condylostylus longicornis TaxID=2530218 RepID=UPI00244DE574|nr:phospholipase B1, membrane-associated-like [Condylostylus longicornis]XP_055382452.1 phospholipase B1, membrane-associated-like [Condylostylus longicornis]
MPRNRTKKIIIVIYFLGIFNIKLISTKQILNNLNVIRPKVTNTYKIISIIRFLPIVNGYTRITMFDNLSLRSYFHMFRNFVFNNIGRTSQRTEGHFLQIPYSNDDQFPCGLNNSKSATKPNSVHKLRPGDIDVIAAMGDSLTAGTGAASTKFVDLFMENRGLVWSIGGQYNWRNVTTLPNILKVFNPKLVGYSRHDSFPFHLDSQFNVAEIGAVSSDLPFMAKVLVQRIKNDSRVNFEKSWKMVTICMGGNDFCTFICTMKNPEILPKLHRRNMIKALRYLRDNLPRTFVNVVTEPPPHKVVLLKTNSKICKTINHLECSCFVGNLFKQDQKTLERYERIHEKFSQVEEEVTKLQEFRNLTEFAVVFQPFSRNLSMMADNGKPDYTLLAYDCFHISQKGNAWVGTTLWNSLLQADGEKELTWSSPHKKFLCPTKENPYFLTYDNSRSHS